ncbi:MULTISPECIES: hypothetical protein [Paenibacillus]|uniref:Phospholipase C/D domain-containing protein n=1 Tax=Paenibacillus vini TaxID=1476024 RepID=A0ABQ4MJ59_9BACL|nr:MULTISPECIES: hypothetical protein [Paenibacillus]MBQ4897889.1 hypothetical protein [Paenibacillus sp. Marseille-P2973]GIP56025.1 hypothetical protein J42TS3_50600 [Paenibacillus vini]
MATWVTHFRIAEKLIDLGLDVSPEEFLVGNIGPDCGLANEEGIFYPPKEITHFKVDGKINADLFYHQYILNKERDLSKEQLSFYLGYYFHLLTDLEWSSFYKQKKIEPAYQDILGTPEYWYLVKRDWYVVDFKYLKMNEHSLFFSIFQNIKSFPDLLDIFPQGQINEQVRRITQFYLYTEVPDDYELVYLMLSDVEDFVESTVTVIKEVLNAKQELIQTIFR